MPRPPSTSSAHLSSPPLSPRPFPHAIASSLPSHVSGVAPPPSSAPSPAPFASTFPSAAASTSSEPPSRDSPRRAPPLHLISLSLPSLAPQSLPAVTRSQLCKSSGIPYRDLRILDSPVQDVEEPAILVRDSCIVYAGEGVRAIVRSDRLVLVRGQDDVGLGGNLSTVDTIASSLNSLESRLASREPNKRTYPFEFNALEALLLHSLSLLQRRVASLALSTDALIASLKDKGIAHDGLLDMLDLSQAVDRTLRKVAGMEKAVAEVLGEEEDMAAMYLTAKQLGKPHNEGEDDEVELLLEAYLKQSSTLHSSISSLSTRLASTSRHVDLVMAATRNRLLHLEIKLAIATAAAGLGSLFAGLLGMNLMNHFEEHPYAFYIFTLFLFFLVIFTANWGMRALSRTSSARINDTAPWFAPASSGPPGIFGNGHAHGVGEGKYRDFEEDAEGEGSRRGSGAGSEEGGGGGGRGDGGV